MRSRTLFVCVALLCTPLFVWAQSDGSVPPDPKPADGGTSVQPVDPAPADPAPASTQPAAGTEQGTAPASSAVSATPAAGTGTIRPTTTIPTTPSNSNPTTPSSSGAGNPVQDNSAPTTTAINLSSAPDTTGAESDTNPWLWVVIGIVVFGLALMPFGFLPAGFLRKKPKTDEDSDNRCFDIKKLMEEKLKELTDVKAMAKEKAIEKGKERMRDAVSGTAAGDILVRAQKLEEQYGKLKKLYEECQIDVDRYALKGVLVENSLLDKKILEQLRVVRTRTVGDRVVHDIRLSTSQIDDIQKNMVDTKWFFHLWKPGTDDVTVVFKDKLFSIKHSDMATWQDAIAHGVAHGIPKEQLVFHIE